MLKIELKFGKKKTCLRCRADRYSRDVLPKTCSLGYNIEWCSFDDHGFTAFSIPQEPCPKPKTYKDLMLAENNYKKSTINVNSES